MTDKYIFPIATITPKYTGAYVAGRMVGGAFQFNLKAQGIRANGGLIVGVTCIDNDLEGAPGDLFLFGGALTGYADDVAFDSTITYVDMQKRIGRVTLGTFESYTNCKIYNTDNQATPFKVIPYVSFNDDGILSGIFKTSGTPNYASPKQIIFMLHMINQGQ